MTSSERPGRRSRKRPMALVDEEIESTAEEWPWLVASALDNGFTFFDFLTAVDLPDGDPPGFDVVLRLVDITEPGAAVGLQVTARLPYDEPLASITGIFPGAAWHERECAEMFGIEFAGFVDDTGLGLRPLLLPEGFSAHPLRKDFVLASRAVKPWPGAKEPGESSADLEADAALDGSQPEGRPRRRRASAPGVPGPEWGPR